MLQFGGMKEGDFIVAIGEKDVKWAVHEEVVRLIKDAGDSLSLKLVTPMDRNYLKVRSITNSLYTSNQSLFHKTTNIAWECVNIQYNSICILRIYFQSDINLLH